MDSVKVICELPADLVERAQAVGIDVTDSRLLIDWLETKIRQRQVMQDMQFIMKDLQSSPLDEKPTLDEIEAEIRAYHEEQIQNQGNISA